VTTGADGVDPRNRSAGRRRLAGVCLVLLGAAAALEGAARLAWFTAGVDAVGRGTVPVTAVGADLVPALSALALFAVASVAAAVALGGPLRRVVGGLVAAAGGWTGVAVARLLLAPPASTDLAALPGAPAGGVPVPGPAALHPGPGVAALGAALLLAAGVVLVVAERRLPRLGARYTVAGTEAPVHRPAAADPDRAAWDALDAGRDPTADPPAAGAEPARPSGDAGRTGGGAADRAV
jgi:uncharacterized membrane protein (TIGR02234 family)